MLAAVSNNKTNNKTDIPGIAFPGFRKDHRANNHGNASLLSYFIVKNGQGYKTIPYSKVRYVEAVGNYMKIVTGQKIFLAYCTMKRMEKFLESHSFIRVNRRFMIPLQGLESISQNTVLANGLSFPLTGKYKKALLRFLEEVII